MRQQRSMQRVYKIVSPLFRHQRMQSFVDHFRLAPQTSVLDVGGTPSIWELVPVQPHVTLLNRTRPRQDLVSTNMAAVIGDACTLPYPDKSFDVVFSNSVIEHLGERERQAAFAQEARRVGQSYYVQTPNRWFPIEPHYVAPFIHWLPRGWQRRLVRWVTPWGWVTRPSPEQCAEMVAEIRLLDATELRSLFPDGELKRERVLGLTKSFQVIRAPLRS